MNDNQLSVTRLCVSSFDYTSAIASERPGTNHFTERRDFPALRKTRFIGVLITLRRAGNISRACRGSLRVVVGHFFPQEEILTRIVTYAFAPGEEEIIVRTDVRMDFQTIVPARDYDVMVTTLGSDEVLAHKPFFLFPMAIGGAHCYHVQDITITATDGDGPWPPLVVADARIHPEVFISAYFDAHDFGIDRWPEIGFRVVWPDGSSETKYIEACRCYDREPIRVKFDTFLTIGSKPRGVVYVEYLIWGRPIYSLLFSTDGADREGRYNVDMCERIHDYTPDSGPTLFARRMRL